MGLTSVEIVGYRSIRKLRFPLRRLTVLVGGNGVGKTNIYRSLELLQAAATGTIAREIAREGGLGSVFWAGGRNLSPDGRFDPKYRTHGLGRGESARIMLEARLEDLAPGLDESYRIEIGDPAPGAAAFPGEAQIKSEDLELLTGRRPTTLLERRNMALTARDGDGKMVLSDEQLLSSETGLAALRGKHPEISIVRQTMANWRFFHGFRTDQDSPLRRPCHAVTAPILESDGRNLAAVFATIRHIRGETRDLDTAVDAAFPGAELIVPPPDQTASFSMLFPETPQRPFAAHELSDGTLHFLALMGALLSYRLPPFIALNEPETSLHPDLLPALAATIVKAAERTQVWVVTHSQPLAAAIEELSGVAPREVLRTDDGTTIAGLNGLGLFSDD